MSSRVFQEMKEEIDYQLARCARLRERAEQAEAQTARLRSGLREEQVQTRAYEDRIDKLTAEVARLTKALQDCIARPHMAANIGRAALAGEEE